MSLQNHEEGGKYRMEDNKIFCSWREKETESKAMKRTTSPCKNRTYRNGEEEVCSLGMGALNRIRKKARRKKRASSYRLDSVKSTSGGKRDV